MKPISRFDTVRADHVVRFFRDFLVHTTGKWRGVPFVLEPWQENDIIRPLFGTVTTNEAGEWVRQYRKAWIEIPSGNGKSELLAGILLYLLLADGENAPHVFGAAVDKEQAGLVYNVARQMVELSPRLKRFAWLKVFKSTKRILNLRDDGYYTVIPGDPDGADGFVPHGIGFDEVHRQKKRELWDVLENKLAKRQQPLMVGITTAGVDRESIAYELHGYALQILAGTLEDPSFFAFVLAAPEDADWQDEKVWRSVNPAIGVFKSIAAMRDEARKAASSPAAQNSFRRLHLNQWTSQVDRYIDIDLWDANAGIVDEGALAGRECFGGLDLSAGNDLTAWAMVFPDPADPERIECLVRFWCPRRQLTNPFNRWGSQYRAWERLGLLTVAGGQAIDYAVIKAQVLEDATTFRLVDLNIDRLFQAYQLGGELLDAGLTVIGMQQGFLSYGPPMKEMLRRLLERKVRHGGNPVLRWNVDSLAVLIDPAGNYKPDKRSSQGKIDGFVALEMALERAMRHQEQDVPIRARWL